MFSLCLFAFVSPHSAPYIFEPSPYSTLYNSTGVDFPTTCMVNSDRYLFLIYDLVHELMPPIFSHNFPKANLSCWLHILDTFSQHTSSTSNPVHLACMHTSNNPPATYQDLLTLMIAFPPFIQSQPLSLHSFAEPINNH